MSFPRELTLRTTPDGIRLFIAPVREIEGIREHSHRWEGQPLSPGENPLAGLRGELFDIRAEIDPGTATEVGFTLRGEPVRYDVGTETLSCLGKDAPLRLQDGRIRLQILLDRTSIEVFGNDGRVSMPTCFLPGLDDRSLGIYASGGDARVLSLEVHELRSAWE